MNHFFKLAAVSALFVSTMSFANTAIKDSSVICKMENGDYQVGRVKTLYKDLSLQIDKNIKLNKDGYVYGVESGVMRIEAKACSLFEPISDADSDFKYGQSVICETGKSLDGTGFKKELGKIKAVLKNKIFVEIDSVLKDDGSIESVGFSRYVSNKACSVEETVEALEVNGEERGSLKDLKDSDKKQKTISTSNQ